MKKQIVSLALVLIIGITLMPELAPRAAAEGSGSATISAGVSTSFAIKADGSLWAWGSNIFGKLGDGTGESSYLPVKIMESVTAVSANRHGLAIKTDGSLWAWGESRPRICIDPFYDDGTRASDGKVLFVKSPVKIMDSGVVSVCAGEEYTAVLKNDGSLWCYGYDWYDTEPVKVMDNVKAIGSGVDSPYAVKNDGTLWVWKYNYSSQPEDGSWNSNTVPEKVADDIAAVSEGYASGWTHTLAAKTDGTLIAWGRNAYGQLGDGTTRGRFPDRLTKDDPTLVTDNVIAVNAVSNRSFAIKSDGSLWAWGRNNSGLLGDGTVSVSTYDENLRETIVENNNKLTPIKIMDGAASISTDYGHNLVLKNDGSLWAWGQNTSGCLGDGTTDNKITPIKIMDGVLLPNAAPAVPSESADPISAYPAADADYNLITASEWARDGIESAIEKGFIPADLHGDYKNVITRREFCVMAVKWLEYRLGTDIDSVLQQSGLSRDPDAFTDTNDPDILAAYALGITSGTGNNQFTPDGQFTREQAATMIRNTCRAAGMDVSAVSPAGFADIGDASDWAADSINFVRNAAIMQGTGGNNFSPKQTFTREQSIVTFNNMF